VSGFDDEEPIVPDGLQIRRLRRDRGWSRRFLVAEIARARFRESGRRETITPNLLEGIEETNEPIPYSTLCLVATGLDRNPVDLILG
jgi:transcriptional regulator with XRE-family HTH domain